jgi:Fe2+ or Zn2+ uptake regulation protein
MIGVHSPEELAKRYREMGRKVTSQRYVVWQALAGDATHPTAEVIYRRVRAQMPTVSLKTVYQILHELEEMGEIVAVEAGTGALRYDPNVEQPHHHLVCTRCGKVRDLFADFSGLKAPAESLQGFRVGQAEVVFRGLCPDCIAEEQASLGAPEAAGGSREGEESRSSDELLGQARNSERR